MRKPLLLASLILLVACSTTSNGAVDNPYVGAPLEPGAENNFAFHGGDGSGCVEAVVIKGAATTLIGLRAQNTWLKEHFPGSERLRTQQGDCPERITDVVEIRTENGERKKIFFDITDFYGKW